MRLPQLLLRGGTQKVLKICRVEELPATQLELGDRLDASSKMVLKVCRVKQLSAVQVGIKRIDANSRSPWCGKAGCVPLPLDGKSPF